MKLSVRMMREANAVHHGVALGAVVAMDVEDYLNGVLPAEIYESRTPMQAKCAQAIAARTYAVRKALDGDIITDTAKCQSYSATLAAKAPMCAEAVARTAGMVLIYAGHVIRCYYSNSNGGRTKRTDEVWSAKLPYYHSRDDPWDTEACRIAAAQGKTIKASHGVGLSQVGAEYAARLGEDYADILAFYYPGAQIARYEEDENVGVKTMTGKQLAAFAIKCHEEGVRYWYGTCYYKCTQSLLTEKTKQYPSHYTSKRNNAYQQDIKNGAMCADCAGLIKGAAWTALGTQEAKYRSGGCPDKSADGLLAWCKSQGMPWGGMDSFPDIPGLLLHKDGHVGVSIGGGQSIDLKNFADDTEKDRVESRGWTSWAQLPFVDYGTKENVTRPETAVYTLGNRTLRRGCKGNDVAELQAALVAMGYDCGSFGSNADGVDGDYGRSTEAAVMTFQTDADIEVDGIYGSVSHRALLAMQAAGGPGERGEDGGAADDGSNLEPIYRVTITGVDAATATYLLEIYPGAVAEEACG